MESQEMVALIPHLISPEEKNSLTTIILEDDIFIAIWQLHPDKAPRYDGLSISFYRDTWDIIRKDLVKILRGVQSKFKIGGGINSTFLALIPKET
jgi:hypothetical protein